jgi:hypothetical protein
VKDKWYLQRVMELPCCLCERDPCDIAHHILGGGMGLKSSDRMAIPLCDPCHRELHMHNGRFKTMEKWERRQWEAEMSEKTRWTLGTAELGK